MDIELIKVNNNNHETFENIYEFYLYEISRYYNYDVEENGKFSNDNTKNYFNVCWDKHHQILPFNEVIEYFKNTGDKIENL